MVKVKNTARIRNRYNKIPHLTKENTWKSDKTQENITRKRAKKSAHSKQVTTRLQRGDKTECNTRNTNNKNDPQKKNCLETVSIFFLT